MPELHAAVHDLDNILEVHWSPLATKSKDLKQEYTLLNLTLQVQAKRTPFNACSNTVIGQVTLWYGTLSMSSQRLLHSSYVSVGGFPSVSHVMLARSNMKLHHSSR